MIKKAILLAAIIIFIPIVLAADCQIALPRYGRIQCDFTNQKATENFTFTQNSTKDGHPISIFEHTCVSNCEFDAVTPKADVSLNCPSPCMVNWNIYKNGGATPIAKSARVQYGVGDTIRIEAACCGWPIIQSVTSDSQVIAHFDQIKLNEAWAGSLPELWLNGTEKCILNEQVEQYKSYLTDAGSYIDPTQGDTSKTKPTSTYSTLDDIKGNMRPTENYIFVKDWQTGIANISLTYDKSNNAYWCGGVAGKRKIYHVNEIQSQGNCYDIPQSIALDNIECCVPPDCAYKGAGYTCNPDDWKCEETKPCNSDLECQQTFSSGVCENRGTSKSMVSWGCDLSKRWGNYSGTCTKSERTVQQCPTDCTSSEYYNEKEGICKSTIVLIDCPPGKCCNGGDYKPQQCDGELECCIQSGATIGECKQSCAPPPAMPQSNTQLPLSPGAESSNQPTAPPNLLLPVIVLILLGGGGFAVYYFYYMQPKQAKPHQGVKHEVHTATAVCGKCGMPLKKGAKFCSGCGAKL